MKKLATVLVILVVVATCAVIITAQVAGPLHIVRDHETISQLIWSQTEAYVVSGVRRDGRSGSLIDVGWQIVRGLFGAPFQFKESRQWVLVSSVAHGDVTTNVEDGQLFHALSPFEGTLYWQMGPVMKWNGQDFEPASSAEAQRFKAAGNNGEVSYANVNGWSSRYNLLNQGDKRLEFPLSFDNGKAVVIADATNSDLPSLRAQFEGRESVDILVVDQKFRWVDAGEYERLMRQPLQP